MFEKVLIAICTIISEPDISSSLFFTHLSQQLFELTRNIPTFRKILLFNSLDKISSRFCVGKIVK